MQRVGILISGRGTNMQALVRAASTMSPQTEVLLPNRPSYEIAVAISHQPEAPGLAWAKAQGLQTLCINHRDFRHATGEPDRVAHDQAISTALQDTDVNIVCLAGYMRILTPGFIQEWQGRILNIHPSLLPKYKGVDTHARALAAGETQHGCTVHLVTSELDSGPILAQRAIDVVPADTAETLAKRLLEVENRLYPEALIEFLNSEFSNEATRSGPPPDRKRHGSSPQIGTM